MALHRLTTEIHQAIVDFIDSGRPFALATVLKATGSTPRQAGTKAIVDANGDIWGTVGGGQLEAEARRLSVEAIASKRAIIKEFRFAGNDPAADVPVCGGTMRLLIDPAAADHRAAYADAADALRQHRRGLLVTTFGDADRPCVNVEFFGDDAEQAGHQFDIAPKPNSRLAERLVPNPLLIIAGGGHVGQALARQADLVRFDCLVIDDRPEFTDPSLFPPQVSTRCGQFADLIRDLSITEDVYIALVGRGHLVDAKALAACIDKPAGYIGMMGSRRKIALLRKDFIESGKATAEQFDRVHAPIGLEIGAQSVPEIAVSIVAELIAVRSACHSPHFR